MGKVLLLLALCAVTSASVVNLNEICSGILYYALPHPADPTKYIGCVQGRGTIMGCLEADEVFDEFSVACVKEIPPRPPFEQICEDVVVGWFPSPYDCTEYIVCQDGRPHIRSCPVNNIFDVMLPGCVPGNAQTCELAQTVPPTESPTNPPTEPTTNPPTEPPTMRTTTEFPTEPPTIRTTTELPATRDPNDNVLRFNCHPDGYGNIPHLTDCNRYFECIQGVRHPRMCPPGLIFDVIRADCGESESSLCATNIRCG